MYCLISATSKHQFKCTVHPSTLCGCWMSQKTQSQVGLTWNKMYSVANQWADTMNYKYYILKKKSRRPLKLPSDHSVGLISQHWILNKCIHDSNFFVDRQVNGHCLHLLALNVLNHSITWMYEQSRVPRLPFLASMPALSLTFHMGKYHTVGIPKILGF